MVRRVAIAALLAIVGATVAAGEPDFQPGAGLASLDSGATGVFELGTVRFGNATGQLQALVHHGRVLQVHCRHDGRWLAKRGGSTGGKAIAPTKLDELSAIAGGLNQDVRQAPAATRQSFARAAGLVLFGDAAASAGPGAQAGGSVVRSLRLVATAHASSCGPIGCRVVFRHGAPGAERFVISADPESGLWGFQGYGLVAIWPVPQVD